MADLALAGIIALVIALFLVVTVVMRSVWIVPQARARNVERLGRYRKTLQPGLNFIIPFVDRVKPLIDLREQVVAFQGQPVITEDNVVVHIDTVLFFQVTDPRAADYEIVNYIKAIEQLTATQLRNVIGTLDLEATLSSRDRINTALRGVLDDASGKWGIRVTRVEIKAIEPPQSIKDAMEKQMRAEREKRATILQAEGARQAAILKAEGEAKAIEQVFTSIHDNDADPKLLAYQYLQTLPKLAQGEGNTFWVIPGELTSALKSVTRAFGGAEEQTGVAEPPRERRARPADGTAPAAGHAEPPDDATPAERNLPDLAAPAEAAVAPEAVGAAGERRALDERTPPFELAPGGVDVARD